MYWLKWKEEKRQFNASRKLWPFSLGSRQHFRIVQATDEVRLTASLHSEGSRITWHVTCLGDLNWQ
jgi:hypothetical protein